MSAGINRTVRVALVLVLVSAAQRHGPVDEKRAVADVLPLQSERLAGPQAGVGEHIDERGVAKAEFGPEVSTVIGASGRTLRER
jgi:hypothetical protein